MDSGLAPVTDGWFVVNVREAAWLKNEAFGARCVFEGDRPVFRRRPELGVQKFADVGVTLAVIAPGLCLLLIDGEERPLKAWDFVHCPPGTAHGFVGAGEEPCIILMTGRRTKDKATVYPHFEIARRLGAGVESETNSALEAYAPFPHWEPERPETWEGLPWAFTGETGFPREPPSSQFS